MAQFDQTKVNLKRLREADQIQDKTLEALTRARRDAAETEQLGTETYDQLARQGDQMDQISSDVTQVNVKLDRSAALQKNFDNWAGNLFGRGNMSAGSAVIQKRNEEYSKVKEVYQDQTFNSIFRTWHNYALVLCSDPTKECSDLFDPNIAEHAPDSSWVIDYSMGSIDAEGWTYALNFNTLNKSGAGDSTFKMNSFVRRRKWRFAHGSATKAGGAYEQMLTRNDSRKIAAAINSKRVDNVGYVPREKQSLLDTGMSSAGMMGSPRREVPLDEESAAGMTRLREKDVRIDEGIQAIDRSVDNIAAISTAMKNEVTHQSQKLDKLDKDMEVNAEKHRKVNARQRFLLNTN